MKKNQNQKNIQKKEQLTLPDDILSDLTDSFTYYEK